MKVLTPSDFPAAFANAFSEDNLDAVMNFYCKDAVLLHPGAENFVSDVDLEFFGDVPCRI